MIYNKSLQGRFVSGMFTMPVLLSCALALWLFLSVYGELNDSSLSALDINCTPVTRFMALLCYIGVALILNSLHLFEVRVNWLISLFLWLTVLSTSIQFRLETAVSVLALAASFSILFSCQLLVDQERRLFTSFAIIASVSLLSPVLLLVLPFLVAFSFFSNILTIKRFFAMLLGTAAPFWIVFGLCYVYEPAWKILAVIKDFFECNGFLVFLPPSNIMFSMAAELMVLLPSSILFFSSSSPGKPMLRRRLFFLILLNSFLMLLSFIMPLQSELLYACRLPGNAVLLSYIFVLKITKLSNIYFIFVHIIWVTIALYSLWMGLY